MIQPEMLLQNRYRIGQQLGKGGLGEIFEVDDRGTQKVIKILNLESFTDLVPLGVNTQTIKQPRLYPYMST